jgi:hypothetical protein
MSVVTADHLSVDRLAYRFTRGDVSFCRGGAGECRCRQGWLGEHRRRRVASKRVGYRSREEWRSLGGRLAAATR